MMFRILATVVAAALAGCAAQPDFIPPANDPASPQAPESPVASTAPRLSLDELAPAAASGSLFPNPDRAMRPMDMRGMDMKDMDMPGMAGMDHGSAPATTLPATQPPGSLALYTCKMHPQVVSDHPSTCPICGMTLVPKEGAK